MLKSIVKYLISSLLAAGLLYWAFSKSELHYNDILLTFQRADYNWVAASVIIAIISHLLRALRWEQLLGAMSYHPGTVRTFSAVLIGYFANFLVPRLGEVSRCGSLKKTANINPSQTETDCFIMNESCALGPFNVCRNVGLYSKTVA